MECNKDEAIRAKDVAEKKMEHNNFEGARKIAKRAQSLYPELENIMQLLAVCDVHCSSQKMLFGYEKDWYEILQIERFSDEVTVKKQYRRLALFLHPDKNRFPGAEAAFKLICEANAVLSDPTKKSLYDNKIRVSARSAALKAPVHHINKNPQFNEKYRAQSNARNGFGSLNQHQAARPSFSVNQEEFWTMCPFCKVRYKYHREFVNRSLHCQKCSKLFIAYEVSSTLATKWGQSGAQPNPLVPGLRHPAAFQEKNISNTSDLKMDFQNDKRFSASHANSHGNSSKNQVQQEPEIQTGNKSSGTRRGTATNSVGNLNCNASRKPVQREPRVHTGSCSSGVRTENAAKINGDLKAEEANFCNVNSAHTEKNCEMPNGDAITKESGDLKNESRKRGRKQAMKSSESYDSSSESDGENMTGMNFGNIATEMESGSTVHFARKSTRKRQHVMYFEGDDDVSSLLKGSRARKLPDNSREAQRDALDDEDSKPANIPTDADCFKSKTKQMGRVHLEGSLQDNGTDPDKKDYGSGKASGMSSASVDADADAVEIDRVSDQDSYSSDDSDGGLYDVPEPEFSDFDKDRKVDCFAVNQIWACFDPLDSMPRYYARVKKILKSPFKLSFAWLEVDPNDEADKKWANEERPVGCGNFKLGTAEDTSHLRSFSHRMSWEKGQKRGSFNIYPREGETWAIFKDWDKIWSSKIENLKLKYEIVEVLSNFVAGCGIKVCYLDKISDFVSLFRRTSQSESFLIGPKELYMFSHRVPCFKMSGSEREGVPKGSFELDPASLPLDPDDLYYPSKEKVKCANLDPEFHGSSVESVKRSGKPPIEVVDLDEINGEMPILRRSPRKMNFNR